MRLRAAGYVLTFPPLDSAVLYTGDSGQVRAYPDAIPGTAAGSKAASWEVSTSESREVCALVPV